MAESMESALRMLPSVVGYGAWYRGCSSHRDDDDVVHPVGMTAVELTKRWPPAMTMTPMLLPCRVPLPLCRLLTCRS